MANQLGNVSQTGKVFGYSRDSFYRFKELYEDGLQELQNDLDMWLKEYNEDRLQIGKYCYGKTTMQTFIDSLPMTKEKMIGYGLQ